MAASPTHLTFEARQIRYSVTPTRGEALEIDLWTFQDRAQPPQNEPSRFIDRSTTP